MTEDDILALIEGDPWMMAVIHTAAHPNLPDWMIGAGFVRNKVWDYLHGIARPVVDTADIDLIYFDATDTREETEKAHDARLQAAMDVPWSCKNQARMHAHNGNAPYASSLDALSRWVETPTAVAVTLCGGALKLFAPHGISDLVNLIVRPTPQYAQRLPVFHQRMAEKNWLAKWPKLQVVT